VAGRVSARDAPTAPSPPPSIAIEEIAMSDVASIKSDDTSPAQDEALLFDAWSHARLCGWELRPNRDGWMLADPSTNFVVHGYDYLDLGDVVEVCDAALKEAGREKPELTPRQEAHLQDEFAKWREHIAADEFIEGDCEPL
jgi:hypothetical protein